MREQGPVPPVPRRRTEASQAPLLGCTAPRPPSSLQPLGRPWGPLPGSLCSLSGSFMLSTEGRNTSRCSFSSSGVLSTVSSNSFREMTSWLSADRQNDKGMTQDTPRRMSWFKLLVHSDLKKKKTTHHKPLVSHLKLRSGNGIFYIILCIQFSSTSTHHLHTFVYFIFGCAGSLLPHGLLAAAASPVSEHGL